ncbi:unnamed protein product [Clavelina lepadiformis]|uniref:C2H2-type domain-containing protein n=1 Tax=Clavelina lepadiformis TaxID=159417 RepID=A0ABP0GUQ5_CLALP
MHKYHCNRCGRQFGSPSAVKMHLRNKHFDKSVCEKCGVEVYQKLMQTHVGDKHLIDGGIVPFYQKARSKSTSKLMKPKASKEDESFWEVPDERLQSFVAPGTLTKCRLCGVSLGGVHGREQHERDAHQFTTQVRNSLALRFPALNMLDILQPCDVRDYVQHDLTPVLSGSTECNKEVNILVDFLIEQLPLDVSQVIRGGSYGKRTCLKGHSDLDMVMFLEGMPLFGGDRASANRLAVCIRRVKTALQRSLLATRILVSEETNHALRFQYKCYNDDHIHHVDLLPCNDLLGQAPTTEDKNAIFELIANCKNTDQLLLLNTCLLQLQVEFVRQRPRILHDLIRLVKHWKRVSFGKATSECSYRRMPNSYTLELITIYTWEKHGKPIRFSLTHGLAAVFKVLTKYENLCVVWFENYSRHCKWLKETLQAPR